MLYSPVSGFQNDLVHEWVWIPITGWFIGPNRGKPKKGNAIFVVASFLGQLSRLVRIGHGLAKKAMIPDNEHRHSHIFTRSSIMAWRRRLLVLLVPVWVCHGQQQQQQHPDITADVEVPGLSNFETPPRRAWADSYSVNGVCYCASNFDNIGDFAVPVVAGDGYATVRTVCQAIGSGPGINTPGAIRYNTIQCGHPPFKSREGKHKEHDCPGRVDVSHDNFSFLSTRFLSFS